MRVKEGKPCGLSLGNIQCRTRSGEGSVPRGCHERDGQGSKAVPGRERKQKIKVEHFPELVKCTNPQVQNSCDPPPPRTNAQRRVSGPADNWRNVPKGPESRGQAVVPRTAPHEWTDGHPHTNRRPGTTQMASVCVCGGEKSPPLPPSAVRTPFTVGPKKTFPRSERCSEGDPRGPPCRSQI